MCRFLPFIAGSVAFALLLAGCSLTPPPLAPEHQRAQQRARTDQRDADQLEAQLRIERQASTEDLVRIDAEIATLDAPRVAADQQYHAQMLAHASYTKTLAFALEITGECEAATDPMAAAAIASTVAATLGEHVADPARDRALEGLDRCRQVYAKRARVELKEVHRELQAEFATTIEDDFDANNPYSRGQLSATVKGAILSVRMRGNFEGRARHSQDQVDSWCIAGDGLFTRISLKNAHGSFSCEPEDGPSDLIDSILADAQLTTSWQVVGEQPIPSSPSAPPLPSPNTREQLANLASERAQVEAAIAEQSVRATAVVEQQRVATQSLTRLDAKQRDHIEDWGQTRITRAANAQIAGVVFVALGGVAAIGTAAAVQSGAPNAQDLVPVGVGLSVPLLVTGIVFLVAGGVRKQRVRQVLGCVGTGSPPSYCNPAR